MAKHKEKEAGRENGRKARGIHFRVPTGFHVGKKRSTHRRTGRKARRA